MIGLHKQKETLITAKIDFRYEYWEWVCFTAQQAAEKATRALLLHYGIVAWGHAITVMLQKLVDLPQAQNLVTYAQLLDAYYMSSRYPNGFPQGKPSDYFNRQKAQEALDAAETIIQFCSDHLYGSQASP
jgi:HEPN domain-containing protein